MSVYFVQEFVGFFETETSHVAQAGLESNYVNWEGKKERHTTSCSRPVEGPRFNTCVHDLKAEKALFGKRDAVGSRGQGEEQ